MENHYEIVIAAGIVGHQCADRARTGRRRWRITKLRVRLMDWLAHSTAARMSRRQAFFRRSEISAKAMQASGVAGSNSASLQGEDAGRAGISPGGCGNLKRTRRIFASPARCGN
jgi:hypothetical protein